MSENTANVTQTTKASTPPVAENNYDQHRNWIIIESLFALYTLITIWIIIAMLHYGMKHRKFYCSRQRQRKHGTIYTMISIVFLTSIPRLILLQIIQASYAHPTNDIACNIGMFGFKVFYILSLFGTYVTLWSRQWLLYARPNFKNLTEGWFRRLQYACLVLIILTSVLGMINHIIPIRTEISPIGCKEILKVTAARMMHLANVALTAISQVMLVVLFSYPLYKQIQKNKNMRTTRRESTPEENNTTVPSPRPTSEFSDPPTVLSEVEAIEKAKNVKRCAQVKKSRRPLISILKRSSVLSGFCAFSDITIFLIVLALNKIYVTQPLGLHVYLTIFETNAFVNQIVIFFMLNNWKNILLTLFLNK
uniref:uncharacterized protein LOC120338207 n=1 Tax=Styela clava TaxID=7725 RepID=UPI00193A862F|nr:uncharacterized protein LOC120338207 [Styela clava]